MSQRRLTVWKSLAARVQIAQQLPFQFPAGPFFAYRHPQIKLTFLGTARLTENDPMMCPGQFGQRRQRDPSIAIALVKLPHTLQLAPTETSPVRSGASQMVGELADHALVDPVAVLESPTDTGADLPMQLDQRHIGGLQHPTPCGINQSDEISKARIGQGTHVVIPKTRVRARRRRHTPPIPGKPGEDRRNR